MDSTAWVAVAGIIGTAVSPWVVERLRAKNARREQLTSMRLVIYADLLRVTARLAANATMWATYPAANLEEVDSDELDSLVSRAQVVSSKDVYQRFNELAQQIKAFQLFRVMSVLPHLHKMDVDAVDDQLSIQYRGRLGELVGIINATQGRIQDAIRNEMLD